MQLALALGVDYHKAWLKKMGQLDRLRTELPESAEPIVPKRWGELNTVTIAFGHGLAVAPLQAVEAVGALVTGGRPITPPFLRRTQDEALANAPQAPKPQTSEALPRGQREAATALGLSYWRATGLIVLPQALRISLPAMTNEFIALIKNTTLVLVVSILDLLGIAQASLADPNWVGMTMEAYAFSGAIYWLICFALSRWSRSLERKRRL